MAVISETGLIVGSVSGGCVEDDLVHEVRQNVFWAPMHRPWRCAPMAEMLPNANATDCPAAMRCVWPWKQIGRPRT